MNAQAIYAVGLRKFPTLDTAIDHAVLADRCDGPPYIRRSELDADGQGRTITEEWRPYDGDAGYYLAANLEVPGEQRRGHDADEYKPVRVGNEEFTHRDGTSADHVAIRRAMEADGWLMTERTTYLDGRVPMGFRRAVTD